MRFSLFAGSLNLKSQEEPLRGWVEARRLFMCGLRAFFSTAPSCHSSLGLIYLVVNFNGNFATTPVVAGRARRECPGLRDDPESGEPTNPTNPNTLEKHSQAEREVKRKSSTAEQ